MRGGIRIIEPQRRREELFRLWHHFLVGNDNVRGNNVHRGQSHVAPRKSGAILIACSKYSLAF